MTILLHCSNCGETLNIAPRRVGARIKCPNCGTDIIVADCEAAPGAPAPAGGARESAGTVALAAAPATATHPAEPARQPLSPKPTPPLGPRTKGPPTPLPAAPAQVAIPPAGECQEYAATAVEELWYVRTAASAPVFFTLAAIVVILIAGAASAWLLGAQMPPIVVVGLAVVGAAVAVYGLLLGTAAVLLAVHIARHLRLR